MITIYKYEIFLTGEQTLSLPAGAEILTIQAQNNLAYAWVKLDTGKPEVDRTILASGTGLLMSRQDAQYISTVQFGGLVVHFFEVAK